ncbi:unnamed protein product [Adineta steineri]|uniref:FG-GAP repeat protein n=3 Tax=Adineta steineri TaxID=433720 RepID=A0A818V1J1_9BILA|nr:unnamed protein product [Adineta steineri]
MKSSIISNSQPRSVAVGDLNNDNFKDIVVANSGTSNIGIFLSNGNGTFQNQKIYSTGLKSSPHSIVIDDLNNDSFLDIVVANFYTNSIGIFFGYGNGKFKNEINISTGSSHPLFVKTRDLNKDNFIDIIVINYPTNNIEIFYGFGNGSFEDRIKYFLGYDSIPYDLSIEDLNEDNYLDLIIVNYGTSNISILFGFTNKTFLNQISYSTNHLSNPTSIIVKDINNDNYLDIIVANSNLRNIEIFFGYGNGTFQKQVLLETSLNFYPKYLNIDDFNNDKIWDIVIVDSKLNKLYIFLGFGNGRFEKFTTYDIFLGSNPSSIAIADFDNNNQSDIVLTNFDTNNLLILINYSSKSSIRQINYDTGPSSSTNSIQIADLNNDHIIDLVYRSESNIAIRFGLSNGNFSNEIKYSLGNEKMKCQYITIADLNNDKQMDIITANVNGDNLSIFIGYNYGEFYLISNYSTGNGSTPFWVTTADINNDNIQDIISANTGTNSIGIFLGFGNGTFNQMISYSLDENYSPYSIIVNDINNDNYFDMIILTEYVSGDGYIIILFGYNNLTFIKKYKYSTGENSFPFTMTLLDFNHDNYLDIAVANTGTNNIVIFFGFGNGIFTKQTSYSVGNSTMPYYIIATDFNNDNISDLVVSCLGNDEIVLFLGYKNGTFQLSKTYSTGFGSKPYGLTVADLDNNKQLEIIVSLWGSGDIAILSLYDAAIFSTEIVYSTDLTLKSSSLSIADFNNDNLTDIIVANSATDDLIIYFASINNSYSKQIKYYIGKNFHPEYVLTCDINNDNNSDIISINTKNNTFSFIIGYGNETFNEKQFIYSTGDNSKPIFALSNDLNNDNRSDLIIVNSATDNFGIFYNFNYTSFYNQQIYSNKNSLKPTDIIIENFNNDKYPDIAVTFSGNDSLGIFFGSKYGNLNNMSIYSTGNNSQPNSLKTGDFNNDGQLDIVVANWATNNIIILFGYNYGYFHNIKSYSTGNNSNPTYIDIADFNNDYQLDTVVVNKGSNNILILLGDKNGSFQNLISYSTGYGSKPESLAISDLNNDNNMDIIVANLYTHNIGIFFGYGNGKFHNMITYKTEGPMAISIADLNNDYNKDIAIANYLGNNIAILFGSGNGNFSSIKTYSIGFGSLPKSILIHDFNNDQKLDLAITKSGTNEIVILFGFGNEIFLLGKSYSTNINSIPYKLAITDLNNDKKLDILVTNFGSNNIGIFFGYDYEYFGGMTTYSTGQNSNPHSIAIADFNQDKQLDIVVANYGTSNIQIFIGFNNGTFNSMITYSTEINSAPYCVAVAYLNNDTFIDIVVTNSKTNNIMIFFGLGNGNFKIGGKYSTGYRSHPYTITINDFNNDNINDIALTNSGTSQIYFIYGYYNGTFTNQTLYSLGYGYHPYSIISKDLNNDNYIDIIVLCYDTDHFEILLNIC